MSRSWSSGTQIAFGLRLCSTVGMPEQWAIVVPFAVVQCKRHKPYLTRDKGIGQWHFPRSPSPRNCGCIIDHEQRMLLRKGTPRASDVMTLFWRCAQVTLVFSLGRSPSLIPMCDHVPLSFFWTDSGWCLQKCFWFWFYWAATWIRKLSLFAKEPFVAE